MCEVVKTSSVYAIALAPKILGSSYAVSSILCIKSIFAVTNLTAYSPLTEDKDSRNACCSKANSAL